MINEKHPDDFLKEISVWCLFITACISILTFIGWIIGAVFITSINSYYKPIAPSTILCLFILSVSFSAYIKNSENRIRRIIAIACAFFVICICIIISFCFFADIILKAEYLFRTPQKYPAGHMSPVTAINLITLSLGILFLVFPFYKKRLYENLAAFCAISAIITGLILLLGYLYETPFLYKEGSIPVSIPGAISLVFLGMGVLMSAGPRALPVRLFTGPSLRSRLIRAFFLS